MTNVEQCLGLYDVGALPKIFDIHIMLAPDVAYTRSLCVMFPPLILKRSAWKQADS